MEIRAAAENDRDWVRALLTERWGAVELVTRGRIHQGDRLPGFIAFDGDRRVGLVTYTIENGECEIVSLDSLASGKGIGTALVKTIVELARARSCRRVWLITTNDNTGALRFYQKVGFSLVTVHRDAICLSRELKPGIPEIGIDGIPIRDEIELEISLV